MFIRDSIPNFNWQILNLEPEVWLWRKTGRYLDR